MAFRHILRHIPRDIDYINEVKQIGNLICLSSYNLHGPYQKRLGVYSHASCSVRLHLDTSTQVFDHKVFKFWLDRGIWWKVRRSPKLICCGGTWMSEPYFLVSHQLLLGLSPLNHICELYTVVEKSLGYIRNHGCMYQSLCQSNHPKDVDLQSELDLSSGDHECLYGSWTKIVEIFQSRPKYWTNWPMWLFLNPRCSRGRSTVTCISLYYLYILSLCITVT